MICILLIKLCISAVIYLVLSYIKSMKHPEVLLLFPTLHLLLSPLFCQMLVFLLSLCVGDHLSALLYPQVNNFTLILIDPHINIY